MRFRVLSVHSHQGSKLYVTGSYIPDSPDEEAKLLQFSEVLAEANQFPSGFPISEHMVSAEHTILFQSVPIEVLAGILNFQNKSLDLQLSIVMGKNMESNIHRKKVSDVLTGIGLRRGKQCV